jgi:HPt (histidine-containing phosphotransfer) domain-containing protein
LAELAAALAAGDLPTAKRQAHTLKNSADNIGARPVRELSFRMEQLLAAGDRAAAGKLLDDLRAAVDNLGDELSRFARVAGAKQRVPQ